MAPGSPVWAAHYARLGVAAGASAKEIRRAYRKLSLTGTLEDVHEGLGAVLELLRASRA